MAAYLAYKGNEPVNARRRIDSVPYFRCVRKISAFV